MPTNNPREAALLALTSDQFVADWLDLWAQERAPSAVDLRLAREIASGTVRTKRTLDHYLRQVATQGNIKLKAAERWLLRTAAYQHLYLSKIPPFAINSETMLLAQLHSHKRTIPFVNALLRRLSESPLTPPTDLATKYSYTDYFVGRLQASYDDAEAILKAQNQRPPLMARKRGSLEYRRLDSPDLSCEYYIQNITQGTLLARATQGLAPKKILDLCAAPGGKTVLLADLFPGSELYAHDIRTERLLENIAKYQLKVKLLREGDGPFDLIVVDAPCSNSGVLFRRPEARWRLENEPVANLVQTQEMLLTQATSILAKEGRIVYMTCSILPEENRHHGPLQLAGYEETILPNALGFEGGYACTLKQRG